VVIVAEQGTIQWFNEAAGQLLDLRDPEDIGQPILHLVRIPEFHRYFLRGDYRKPLEYRTNGENRRFLQLQITRFGDGDRLLFLRDVTDVVRTEQVRRDFVGNVSHELRTPLTVISGYLGTILDNGRDLNPSLVRALEQMSQQADRMENLLKDLLWLSRIESERKQERRERVDIPCLLLELADELRTTHPGRVIELEVETDEKVTGDYRELYSAVSNLVLNALKYSDRDCPVRVSWRREGAQCLLSVRDQGIGIDSVHFPRLTERFYRVDDSRSSTTGGTGLGLAIVKHVAAAHEAQLRIESELGRGSEFTLVFPCEKGCLDVEKCA
jgi:two-component system phosphate regulon sensor histidine kinase PhoR